MKYCSLILAGIFFVSTFGENAEARAENDARPKRKESVCYVRMANMSRSGVKPAWDTGLDFTFRGKRFAVDVRAGESTVYRKIEISGERLLKIKRYRTGRTLLSRTADLKPGYFHLLVVSGLLTTDSSSLKMDVISFPMKKLAKGKDGEEAEAAEIRFLNGVSSSSVRCRINGDSEIILPEGEWGRDGLGEGRHLLTILYEDKQKQERWIRRELTLEKDGKQLVFLFPGVRYPGIYVVDEGRMEREVLKEIQKEQKR